MSTTEARFITFVASINPLRLLKIAASDPTNTKTDAAATIRCREKGASLIRWP
jgi:hypothetical protein